MTPPLRAPGIASVVVAHAAEADRTRSLAPEVVAAVRDSGLLALSATGRLGGLEVPIGTIARELEVLAAACASTAWCVWNHLCVFHLFCGALGPDHADLLRGMVDRREWVCFPAGAGSGVRAHERGDDLLLEGRAAFGSGARYADWAGVAFVMTGPDGELKRPPDIRFTVVRLDHPGVAVEATWDGAALRASSTDDVVYRDVVVGPGQWVHWHGANRAVVLRDPAVPVIDHRYREDWVGLSALWLAAMAVGVAAAALEEVVEEVGTRRALLGRPMAELPGVQFNLGRAATAVLGAGAAVSNGCAAVDARITGRAYPTERNELEEAALAAFALDACDRAMRHLLRVAGGNGLRERHRFERRYRDFQAMPLHINAHEDRTAERLGRDLLGLPLDPF